MSSSYCLVLISSFIFELFLWRRYNLMQFCRWLRTYQYLQKEKHCFPKILYRLFLFASLSKYSEILFFLFWAGCFFFNFRFFNFFFCFVRHIFTFVYLRFTITFFFVHYFLIFFGLFLPKVFPFFVTIFLLLLFLVLLVLLFYIFNVFF